MVDVSIATETSQEAQELEQVVRRTGTQDQTLKIRVFLVPFLSF